MGYKIKSRKLIIDTMMTGYYSETTNSEQSVITVNFLQAVLSICHKIILTPELEEEWCGHMNRYFSDWLVQMENWEKVERIYTTWNYDLENKIGEINSNCKEYMKDVKAKDKQKWENGVGAMLKDFLLIDAALESGSPIVSFDEKARIPFAKATLCYEELKDIVWVNPGKPADRAIEWLEAGAPSEEERMLGYDPSNVS